MVKMSGQNLKCYNIPLQCTTPLPLSLTCKLRLFEQNYVEDFGTNVVKKIQKEGFKMREKEL